MKNKYYAIIFDIDFYSSSPFTFMGDQISPTFKNRRNLEKWIMNFSNDIEGILSYTIGYRKIKI